MKVLNKCTMYYDNNERLQKLTKWKQNQNILNHYTKCLNIKPSWLLNINIPCKISVIYLYSHQDKIKGRANHSFPEQLDDLEDKVGDKYSRSPINRRVLYSPIVVYFDNLCTFNNYQHHLRWLCSQQDANEYLKETYNWVIRTLADID